ncbi:uncharacterized protein SOCEGT47_017360 [Sorangium cellulosum]|uniref:Uncharacterized protein n=1 Tax=Sorangium cellulosum TaxID=56 RepID=A0A4P2PXI1_SORCE|nr:hypothetical protein [Sorangium cellulosum]AUX21256.1 uncharacterized protein SOCEGT47_017360 [Sorangium cellulosum]
MLSHHARLELRSAFSLRHGVLLLALFGGVVLDSYLLPAMPAAVYRFFERLCRMRSWTEIVLFNDYMAVFAGLFWVGVVDSLRVHVVPVEEGYLDLLLSKPLARSRYLLARVLPIFAVIALMGVGLSLFLPLKIALINGPRDLDVPGTIGAALAIVALVLACVAVLNLVFLFAKETYHAVLLSFVLFAAVVLPGAMFMYRPDLFAGREALRDVVVFPANLVWHAGAMPALAPALSLAALALSAAMILLGARRLERADVG